MSRRDLAAACAALLVLATNGDARSAPDAGATAARDAGAAASHPPLDAGAAGPHADAAAATEPLPPGHPSTQPPAQDPHEEDPRVALARAGIFDPPQDHVNDDPSLAPGTIAVELRDAADRPLAKHQVTLDINIQSIAKGDSRKHDTAETNEAGLAVFQQLDRGSGFSYGVACPKDGAVFVSFPFQLPKEHGMRVILHVYPVLRNVNDPKEGTILAHRIQESEKIPSGSIALEIRTTDGTPFAKIPVKLTAVSRASRREPREVSSETDSAGRAAFVGQETGGDAVYRISWSKDGESFATGDFQLDTTRGTGILYQARPSILIATQLIAEMKDDRIQFEETFHIYNLGKTAWVPQGFVVSLPDGFTALNAQKGAAEQTIEPGEKGARLRGTFAPTGMRTRHVVAFRWQLPWSNDKDVSAVIGLPPHTIRATVGAAAVEPMKLEVDGFPRAEKDQGQPLLVTEKDYPGTNPEATRLTMTLRDIPTAGSARVWAAGLAFASVATGLGFAFTRTRTKRDGARKGDAANVRLQLLAELEELERAHRAGDVGPKTYERARRELIDAIARTLHSPAGKSTV